MAETKHKEHKRLTIAELRNFKGFENYSNEQAEETIKTLEKFSILFYEQYTKHKEDKSTLIQFDNINRERTILNKKENVHERKSDNKKRDAA